MRDERSLEQKLEAMLTVALEPISVEELADVATRMPAGCARRCEGCARSISATGGALP